MTNVSRVWANPVFVRTVGASYDWAMGRQGAARLFGRVVMGADVDRIYRTMNVIAGMPDGAAILDVPCGGGIAMLRLRADQRVRYVGVDISAPMLQRARRRVPVEHRDRVEIVEGSIERMPFGDGELTSACASTGCTAYRIRRSVLPKWRGACVPVAASSVSSPSVVNFGAPTRTWRCCGLPGPSGRRVLVTMRSGGSTMPAW